MNMYSDTIKKEEKSLEERGRQADSFFTIWFEDGSFISEKDCNWRDISIEEKVKYLEGTKTVFTCLHPITKIKIQHGELETEMEVPKDFKVYNAMLGSTTIIGNSGRKTTVLGRKIGLVKDGEVVEERFINAQEGIVQGWKK